jgi:hypothetical protein
MADTPKTGSDSISKPNESDTDRRLRERMEKLLAQDTALGSGTPSRRPR